MRDTRPVKEYPVFRPKIGEDYFLIDSQGKIRCFSYDGLPIDIMHYKNGNCFKSALHITPELIEIYMHWLKRQDRVPFYKVVELKQQDDVKIINKEERQWVDTHHTHA